MGEEVKAEEAAAAPVNDEAPITQEAAAEDAGASAAEESKPDAAGEEGEEEDADMGDGADEEGDEEDKGDEDAKPSRGTKRKADGPPIEPVKLGYKTFTSGAAACMYFKDLMASAPKDTNLNEYEYRVLLDLLQQGHPNADKKIGDGLQAFQVRLYQDGAAAGNNSFAFFVVRVDGSLEDFSYLKCCRTLFADVSDKPAGGNKRAKPQGGRGSPAGGRGGRGGGGRGRGRGARGRGRGRGRK